MRKSTDKQWGRYSIIKKSKTNFQKRPPKTLNEKKIVKTKSYKDKEFLF